MKSSYHRSTLSFEVKIIEAKNIDFKVDGDFFVRCFLPAGNNKRVQLNTKEISAKSHLFWGETFSLECLGSQEAITSLREGNIVLELRWRSTSPFIGRIGGSKLIGTAEVPWENVFDSPKMEFQTWAWMISRKSSWKQDCLKPPKVQISMKIKIPTERTKKDRSRTWEDCGCTYGGCHSCVDYDFYAIDYALEGL